MVLRALIQSDLELLALIFLFRLNALELGGIFKHFLGVRISFLLDFFLLRVQLVSALNFVLVDCVAHLLLLALVALSALELLRVELRFDSQDFVFFRFVVDDFFNTVFT